MKHYTFLPNNGVQDDESLIPLPISWKMVWRESSKVHKISDTLIEILFSNFTNNETNPQANFDAFSFPQQ